MLQISLLGPFAVSQDDKPVISFKTDHSRAILAYTAAYRGVTQRRDALAALLWPDDPNDKALKKFRVELNRLRPVIGDADASPPHYFINRKELEFNPDSKATIDVVLFESLLEEVRLHGHRTLSGCPSCVSKLEQAAELYRGEFMAGFNLNSDLWQGWLTKQREGFKVQALELFGLLNAIQQERGEWDVVLELGQKQIDLDPWNEDGYQALMRAAYALGDRAGAMGWYEACEKVLYEELGVDPSVETLALQQDILDDELVLETKAAADIPNNLPDQLPPFFGREDQIADLVRLLADPQNRLLNLVGIGGIGKTRLALEVGQRVKESFPDGVWFVPLADIQPDTVDPLLNAVADAIRLERDGANWIGDQIIDFMRDKRALIILDNLEHIIDLVVESITGFIEQAQQTAILTTSREPLNLSSETVMNLSGMGEPGIQLFGERAQKVDQKFEVTLENRPEIEQICQMVGGSPLAISLAAAWVRRRSPRQIIEAISKSMDFLTSRMRDVDSRHRSIRAVFDSSWQLLEPEDQGVYAALSVFQGSFTADAVEEIVGASIFDLDILCEKSLVEQAQDQSYVIHPILRQYVSEIQYARDDTFQLHPTMRDYAQEKLDKEDVLNVKQKHSSYYLKRLTDLKSQIFGKEPQLAVHEIQFDLNNILAAWTFALKHQNIDRIQTGIDTIAEFFSVKGRYQDGKTLFATTLELAENQDNQLKGKLSGWQARFALYLLEVDEAIQIAQKTLPLLEPNSPTLAHLVLGEACLMQTKTTQAKEHLNKNIGAESQNNIDRIIQTDSLRRMGKITFQVENQFARSLEILSKALEIDSGTGYKHGIAHTLMNLGVCYYRNGQYSDAQRYLQRALSVFEEIEHINWAMRIRSNLAIVELARFNYFAAEKLLEEVYQWDIYIGSRLHKTQHLLALGAAVSRVGDFNKAESYLQEGLIQCQKSEDNYMESLVLFQLGMLNLQRQEWIDSRSYFGEAWRISNELGDEIGVAYALDRLAFVNLQFGEFEKAETNLIKAVESRRKVGGRVLLLESLVSLGKLYLDTDKLKQTSVLLPEIRLIFDELDTLSGAEDPVQLCLNMELLFLQTDPAYAQSIIQLAQSQLDSELQTIPNKALQQRYLKSMPSRQLLFEKEKG